MWYHTFGHELIVKCKTGRHLQRLEKRHTIRTGELCGRNQVFCHTNLK